MNTRNLPLMAAAVLFAGPADLAADDVTANNPLVPPLFSIDPNSPEVTGGFLLPGDLLLSTDPNLPKPTVEIPAANLSLFDPADDVDALSLEAWVAGNETFVLIFSVDRGTVGAVPPDPNLVALGFPFNVWDQAAKNQAAGDAYMSLFRCSCYTCVPPPLPLAGPRSSNNTLVVNQGDAGGVDFHLSPQGVSPMTSVPPGTPQSNVNAGAGTQAPLPPPPLGAQRGQSETPDWLLFSLAAGSPSLPTIPGSNASGADIFMDSDPNAPGGEELFVGPLPLGLIVEDDIDAMIVFEDGDHEFTPGVDQVIFSLAPGSPSLGAGFSPGDLFTSEGFGGFELYCPAQQLGLAPGDNVNMLDFVPCDHVLTGVYNWAIGYVALCEGDINGDGQVDLSDLAILLSAYGCCPGDAHYYPGADLNGDQCITLCDLATLLAQYGTACP